MARQSATLQSHFVKLYSAFKNGIRGLLVLVGALKCPNSFNESVVVENYVLSLNEFLMSNKKLPKKWWSEDVVH